MLTELTMRKIRQFQLRLIEIRDKAFAYSQTSGYQKTSLEHPVLVATPMTLEIANNLIALTQLILEHNTMIHWLIQKNRHEARAYLAILNQPDLQMEDLYSAELIKLALDFMRDLQIDSAHLSWEFRLLLPKEAKPGKERVEVRLETILKEFEEFKTTIETAASEALKPSIVPQSALTLGRQISSSSTTEDLHSGGPKTAEESSP